jgi:hypothetical protein
MEEDDDDFFGEKFEFGGDDDQHSNDKSSYRNFPVFKKAMEIYGVTRAIVDTIHMENDVWDLRQTMLSNATQLGSKIAAAEGGELFHIRMECAYQIKIAAKELITNIRQCQLEELTDERYLSLLTEQIDDFRISFTAWTCTFDPTHDIDDGWKIGL